MKYLLIVVFAFFTTLSQAGELKMRISADILYEPETILEGNVGKTILYETDNGTFFGGTVYSAFIGDAGGLFIGGFEIGQKLKSSNDKFIETALFFGGGGGAAVVNGDGMLLRPRIMIGQKIGDYELSLGASYMHVTGSDISSPVFEIAMSRPLNWLTASGHVRECEKCVIKTGSDYVKIESVGASFKNYVPNTKLANGDRSGSILQPYYLAGAGIVFNMDNMWGKGWKSFITASGAMGGDAEGYAEVLVGARYGYDMTNWMNVYADAAIGFAGGGDVDTGGGTMVAVNVGAKWQLFNSAELESSIGYIASINGGMHAIVPGLKLSLPLGDNKKPKDGNDAAQYNPTKWSVSGGYSIIPEHENMRYAHDKDTGFLGLTDFKGDLYLGEHIYMTGQALSVTKGGAGGFAIGLVGVGARFGLSEKIDISGELLLGAAAGGAVNVKGGLVGSAIVDVDYKLNEEMSLTANLGWIEAFKGGLNGLMIGAGLKFHTTSFY